MTRVVVLGVFLGLGWAAVTGAFDLANLVLGFALGMVALALVNKGGVGVNLKRAGGLLGLLVLFIGNLAASAVHCALLAIRPRATVRPGVLVYSLKARRELEINLLALMIALAPGILAVEFTTDRRALVIHALDAADAGRLRARIADRLERRILEALR